MADDALMTQAELAELDRLVVASLAAQDPSRLRMLGFGEISVALGWPMDAPRVVCKPSPPFTPAEYAVYERTVNDYITRLRAAGVSVVDTSLLPVGRRGRIVGYVVQPLLDSATLGHNVLKAATPDADHPFLVALADTVSRATRTLSLDAQVTNFAFDGTTLTLVDIATPFIWDDTGLVFDMRPFTRMLPAPLRPVVVRELTGTLERWRDPRGVAVDILANLFREGMPEWIEPTITAMNRRLAPSNPITAAEARAFYDEDLKTWPRLKKLQRAERWWRCSVRRQAYDFFVQTTFKD